MFLDIPGIVPLFIAIGTFILTSCFPSEPPPSETGSLRAYFLDVGQGDACLLGTPGGVWFLYDTGNREDILIPYLKSYGVDTLAAVFISHPDFDHYGALSAVLRKYPVKKVYLPAGDSPNPAWSDLLADLDDYGIEKDTLFAGDTLLWEGGIRVRTLVHFPDSGFQGNEISTVLRVDYRSRRILLTGDIEEGAESGILGSGASISSDILKVAHHGSRTSSGLPFLAAAAPRWAIISCDSLVYGHPHPETIADLEMIMGPSARILRTDREGTVAFSLDERGVSRMR